VSEPLAPYFFEPLGGNRYRATAATGGPWDPKAQHGGPPTALLTRAVEQVAPRDGMPFARLTCEILGPVPVDDVTVDARVSRPGRNVELVEATLSAGERAVARLAGWRITAAPLDVESFSPADTVPPLPDAGSGGPSPDWHDGYLSAIDFRFVDGGFDRPGPAAVWTRTRIPLVAGEEPTPLQRVALVADIGNGISHTLPIRDWYFINPELSIHVFRHPVGEWVAVDARTSIAPGGTGLAESRLHDLDGPIGRGNQALLIARR
jgi:Thioesterase-like superfamily